MSEIETLKAELAYWQRVIGDRMGADDRRFSDMVRDLKDMLACAPSAPAWHEQAAQWIEHKADVTTNSLHCGDNSMTISLTHKHARTLRALAKEIRDEAPPVRTTAINSVVSADRDQIAKVLSVIWLGDTVEWKGFLSKADAFLAYPWPAAEPVAMTASAEPVAWTVERKKSVYDKLAEEGGGTWATYMMMDIEDAFATLPSDAARKAVLAIVKDAFNRGVRSGMKEHTSSKGGNTWVEERPALESRLNAALSAAPVSAWQEKVDRIRAIGRDLDEPSAPPRNDRGGSNVG